MLQIIDFFTTEGSSHLKKCHESSIHETMSHMHSGNHWKTCTPLRQAWNVL